MSIIIIIMNSPGVAQHVEDGGVGGQHLLGLPQRDRRTFHRVV